MKALKSQASAADNPTGLIINNIDIWTSAIKTRSSAGQGSSKKLDLYGIKKLRELILELAVRGKLVPQNPSEEPASVLLERIAVEKSQLVKDKKIKQPKSLPEISEDEKPFALPYGWEWARLQDIGHDWGQKKPDCEFTYIDVGAINKELGFVDQPTVLTESKAPSRARKLVRKGTVIYSTVRPYLLNIAVINEHFDPEPIASTAFAIIHPFDGLSSSFIYRYLRSPSFINYVEGCQTGIAYPAINDKQFFSGVLPVPPTAEQHRMVAKVDELMALCDQLEQQTETSINAHATLVEILLTTLTNSADATELEQNWNRIADHFDTLFTTEHSIDQLKQTVLQLAVMGKLVPQDPNNEPASVLLEKIAAEKAQRVKENKIKKQKPLPPISKDEKPFALPKGWEWCRLGEAILLKNGYAFKSKHFVNEPTPFVLTTPGNFFETGGFRSRGDKTRFYDGDVADDFIFQAGDLMIPMTEQAPGLLGSSAFIPDDGKIYLHNQRLGKLTQYCNKSTSLNFIALFFNTPYLRSELAKSCTGTTVRHTSPDRIYNVLFPILPLAEQHRIVAKVEQMMSLCDHLKARLQQAQQTQLHLADALMEQALTP
ncbi:MAG: restriction endonuclease subunit S [Oceanospirillales bacterium]|nr:restriction endonuclease subunit S [Oceanospirillales bacterium]